jgi:hypothetical protein
LKIQPIANPQKPPTKASNGVSYLEFLEMILQDELAVRSDRQLQRRVKVALFRELNPPRTVAKSPDPTGRGLWFFPYAFHDTNVSPFPAWLGTSNSSLIAR